MIYSIKYLFDIYIYIIDIYKIYNRYIKLIYPDITLIYPYNYLSIYLSIHTRICTYIYIYIYIYIIFFNFVKLNTLSIDKGSHNRYAMPNALLWALWSFKICIWSELHCSVLKERNFLASVGRIWKWALKKLPSWETLKNFWKSDKKLRLNKILG